MMITILLVLLASCVTDVVAMRMSPQGYKNAQYYYKNKLEPQLTKKRELKQEGFRKKREEERKQREQQKDLLKNIKNTDSYEKFDSQLQEAVVAKGWFQGPSKQWKNQIIISAFDLLETYKNRDKNTSELSESDSDDRLSYNILYSHIKNRVCSAIDDYNKKCYFHLYDPHVCSDIMADVDGLLQYSVSGKKIESNFANKLLFGRALEKQDYYKQLLQERNKKR